MLLVHLLPVAVVVVLVVVAPVHVLLLTPVLLHAHLLMVVMVLLVHGLLVGLLLMHHVWGRVRIVGVSLHLITHALHVHGAQVKVIFRGEMSSTLDYRWRRGTPCTAAPSERVCHDVPDNFQIGVELAVVGHGLVAMTGNHVDVVKVKIFFLFKKGFVYWINFGCLVWLDYITKLFMFKVI